MKEIEILFSLNSQIEKTLSILHDKFSFMHEHKIIDTYYLIKSSKELQPDNEYKLSASLRVRQKSNNGYLTYKKDYFDESKNWLYSDEYETSIGDFDIMHNILSKIGFEVLVVVNNTKKVFNNKTYEVVIETVEGLGNFLEIELLDSKHVNIESVGKIKNSMREYLNSLGIEVGEEMNAGKPELLIKKSKK